MHISYSTLNDSKKKKKQIIKRETTNDAANLDPIYPSTNWFNRSWHIKTDSI